MPSNEDETGQAPNFVKEKKIGTSCCKNPKKRSKDWIGWMGFKNKIKQEPFKLGGAQGKPEKTGSFHTTSLYIRIVEILTTMFLRALVLLRVPAAPRYS
jgi:hypothetical protein